MTRSLLTLRIVSTIVAIFIAAYFVRDYRARLWLHRADVAAHPEGSRQEDWAATGEYADRSLRLNPFGADAWYFKGVSEGGQHEYEKARKDLMFAAGLMNNPSLARLTLSGILHEAGQYADAAKLLEQGLVMNPHPELNPARNWQKMAEIYGKVGNGYAALPALWMAALAGDMSGEYLLPIAEKYRSLGHNAPVFPDILAQYFAWVYAPDATLKAWIASFYDTEKHPDLMAAFLENLIARNTAERKDYLGLALSFNEAGQPRKAQEVLSKIASTYSDEPLFHFARGQAAELLGDAPTMRQEYARYLQLAPNAADRAEIEAKLR